MSISARHPAFPNAAQAKTIECESNGGLTLESYFEQFRRRIVGIGASIMTTDGPKPLLYADTVASGRADEGIEKAIMSMKVAYANTHTALSATGEITSQRYEYATALIREHVNASEDDVLITAGSGMTGVVNKLARIMGIAVPAGLKQYLNVPKQKRPVVFVTHMEHHSNILPWRESIADVVTVPPNENGLPDVAALERLCVQSADRPKIGAFTACSNVTGVRTPYRDMARTVRRNDGIAIVDFSANAPYDPIDMHPTANNEDDLDAVMFSSHKFQGGVEGPGVLVFNKKLRASDVPDHPGGGTVLAVDPWGKHEYVRDPEIAEDGGTPPIMGRIRAALAILLKQDMGPLNMREREKELVEIVLPGLREIPGVRVLEPHLRDRIGVVSFVSDDVRYDEMVSRLSSRYGIQVRGGCSCAGPYGHYLFDISRERSAQIISEILKGDESNKPGWVRVSLHPTMTDDEARYIVASINEIVAERREEQDAELEVSGQ